MELDELRNSWKGAGTDIQPRQRSIGELLRHQDQGPLARLKRRFRKSMIVIPALALILLTEFRHQQSFIYTLLKYYLLAFCFFMELYFIYNYRLLGQMQEMNGNVKETLKRQVALLRKGLFWRLVISRSMVALFFILLEMLFVFHVDAGLQDWHQKPLFLRIVLYGAFFLFFWVLTRVATYRRYKRHINDLEELVKEMDE